MRAIVETLMVLLAAIVALAPCAAASASQSSAPSVTHDPEWIGMSMSPLHWDLSNAVENTSYDQSFTICNTGGGVTLGNTVTLDTYIQGSNAMNGDQPWALREDGQNGASEYGILYSVDGGVNHNALSSAAPSALTEGLCTGYGQQGQLRIVTPTEGIAQGQPASTAIFVYAVKSKDATIVSGELQDPAPHIEFTQYPSQASITGALVGSSQEFTLYIRNRTDAEKTFYLSAYVPSDSLCLDGYASLPDANWITFYHDGQEIESIKIAGANQREAIQVQVNIPDDTTLSEKQWEGWIAVTDQAAPQSGINFVPLLCSRLLVSTSSESQESDDSRGIGTATIAGTACGSALIIGILGWRIQSRRHNGHN